MRAPLGLEEERKLVHVKLVLRVDDFHGQVALADLVLTYAQNVGFFLALQAEKLLGEWREREMECKTDTQIRKRLERLRSGGSTRDKRSSLRVGHGMATF